jgi:hypothetical protein
MREGVLDAWVIDMTQAVTICEGFAYLFIAAVNGLRGGSMGDASPRRPSRSRQEERHDQHGAGGGDQDLLGGGEGGGHRISPG